MLGHNQAVGLYTQKKNSNEEMTQMLTWKTRIGKNHGSPQTAEIHYESKVTTMRCTEATTSCSPSSPHAAVTIEATSSLSLTLFHAVSVHTRYTTNFTNVSTTTSKMLALSHIYTYMTFGLFTHVSLPIGRTYRNRAFGLLVLPNFHPEGAVFQQTPPSLQHGMSL